MIHATPNSEIIGLVLARGGSKSIPAKNIAPVAGKPLIHWTIAAARNAHSLTRLIVSTDSQEIARAARDAGAEVPFLRPEVLARDETPSIDAVIHAVEWLREEEGYLPASLMLLQPTSPLRTAEDINHAATLLEQPGTESVASVTPASKHPYWMKHISDDGFLRDAFTPTHAVTRRQDLPPCYAINGALYLTKIATLLEKRTFFPANTRAYVMPPERSLDIDSPFDLHLADLLLRFPFLHQKESEKEGAHVSKSQ